MLKPINFSRTMRWLSSIAVGVLALAASSAYADSISPTSFAATLGIGESVTVHKTVTIDAGGPTSAPIDIKFVFDTTGSMGSALAGAKSTATSLLTTLNSTYGGDLQSGVGYYNDPTHGTLNGLTANIATSQASINGLTAYGGGDYPELGFDGISDAANGSWRTGSNRFIVVLGDAAFKAGSANLASTQAALAASGANLIGINFGTLDGYGDITNLGGDLYTSTTSGTDIANNIIAAISSSFATYSNVTVSDLGGGSPEFSVSTVCTSADIGTCSGATATGAYDRSISRSFGFDVTFTRTAAGDASFPTFALVDGGIVATESDSFKDGSRVPEPGTLFLLGAGLLGVAGARRRRAA